jgi:hypothetical protein
VNTQNLRENRFSLSISRLTAVSYFLTAAAVPGISLINLEMSTPFRQHQLAGFKLRYDQSFNVTFMIDEAMANWSELHSWMISIAPPDSFDQYMESTGGSYNISTAKQGAIGSDARLMLFTAQNMLTYEFVIEDMFPTQLSGVNFNYSAAGPLVATATFSYSKFRLDQVVTVN